MSVRKNDVSEPIGYGVVRICSMDNGKMHNINLHRVLYSTGLAYNLISISKARKRGFKVIINNDKNKLDNGDRTYP